MIITMGFSNLVKLRICASIAMAALCLMPSACAVSSTSGPSEVEKESKSNILTPQNSVIRCIQYDARSRKSLLAGDLSVVLVISAYSPTEENSGFSIYVLSDTQGPRQAVQYPAVYPNVAYDKNGNKDPHRFNINLRTMSQFLGVDKTCFEIEFSQVGNHLDEGFAEIELVMLPTTRQQGL